MNVFDQLSQEHQDLKTQSAALQHAAQSRSPHLAEVLSTFRTTLLSHIEREEPLYRLLDNPKRFTDRGVMHHMRNDHAAIIFTLESLTIRLRKAGLTPEWNDRLKTLLDLLLPHLDQEDQIIFPKSLTLLTQAELDTLNGEMADQ